MPLILLLCVGAVVYGIPCLVLFVASPFWVLTGSNFFGFCVACWLYIKVLETLFGFSLWEEV